MGSFLDEDAPANTVPTVVESNEVVAIVAEVAGITVTAGGITGSTVTGGIAFFDFIITNVGNDPTQFFIPDAPSAISGGTKSGDIKIVGYDADGSGTATEVVLDTTVPSGGGATGTLLGNTATANNGSIRAGATIRIRVPVLISATSGNVSVTMGDTAANAQNQPYAVGNKDLYTVDNLDTAPNEAANPPINGEQEASLNQSVAVTAIVNTPNAPTITCSSDRRIFNTAYNGSTGFLTTGRDTYWDSARGVSSPILTSSGPIPTTGWIDAYNVESIKPGVWLNTPFGESAWISHYSNANHTADGRVDIYFRYQFNLSPTVDVNSFQIKMDFFGDNSVADIFINGLSQKNSYPTVLPQPLPPSTVNPYLFRGFEGPGRAALTLNQNWQTGPNEVVVQIKSDPDRMGFVAESQPSYLCKSDAGDAPISYGTAPHAIITSPKVYLGSIPPDADPFGGQPSSGANGDNTNGTNDEDALTTALKAPTAGTYNLSVPVRNTSGGDAILHAWIDFNKDGKFGAGESQTVSVANNATTASLSWTVPSGTTIGSTYARFRLTTSALSDNTATLDVDERSTISANDGEVEDYSIDLVGNPNLLLVKRITAINGLLTKQNGSSLASYENDPNNPYDDNQNTTPVAPYTRPTTNKWPLTNNLGTDSTFLIGAIDGGFVKPNNTIEYTIYFLSAGDSAANNVLFCDRVPTNVTFSPDAFTNTTANPSGAARGIFVRSGDALNYYTNTGDSDPARYFPPGIEPSTVYPNISCGKNTTGQALPNDNGAVVVNLGNRSKATGILADDRDAGAYGFVRFQGVVK